MLWRIGIAHGDISLNNLMYDEARQKGVLNDFDLSTLMAPGTEIPERQGWERTGTKPFMALELLEHNDGSIERRYRHDLESFGWCLAYHCFEEASTWKVGTFEVVRVYKNSFLLDHYAFVGTKDRRLVNVVRSWMPYIAQQQTEIKKAQGGIGQWNEPSIKESLQEVMDLLEDDPFTDMSCIEFSLPPVDEE